ncbi:MAG: hypothetical protein AB7U20_22010, partial [Planctomycetaceae bacterium]
MTAFRLITDSLRHYWRTNLAVVLGVVAATAVIGGALVVGDSVRDSLRQMSLDRLGGVNFALSGQRFFREELADELADGWVDGLAAPAISLTGSVVRDEDSTTHRSSGVDIYGVDERFWCLMQIQEVSVPAEN